MKKIYIILTIFLIALPLFASGRKDAKLRGTITFYGSAPLDLFAGLTCEDGKQYALDVSKLNLSLEELSDLQGHKIECVGKIYKRKKNSIQIKSLKDGILVLESFKRISS